MPLPSSPVEPIRANAREAVYARLRAWIIRGPLEPAEVIRDAEIAAVLGVSRTPVREAILRLQAEGLVESVPARWTRVAPLRLDQAANLYAVGAVLDALAAEQATPRLSEGDLVEMQRAIDRLHQTEDPEALQDADDAFHGVYYAAANNPLIMNTLDTVLYEVRRLERVNFRDPTTPEVADREHSAILAAFRARDARGAFEAARFNWMNAWPRVERILATPGLFETPGANGGQGAASPAGNQTNGHARGLARGKANGRQA